MGAPAGRAFAGAAQPVTLLKDEVTPKATRRKDAQIATFCSEAFF
jgi:hypothetical protein